MGKLSRGWIAFVRKARYFIIAFWFLGAIASVYPATKLIPATSMTFNAPSGSQAAEAAKVMRKYFPKYVVEGNSAILITVKEGVNASVISNYTRDFTYYLKNGLSTEYSDPDFLQDFESFWTLYDEEMMEAAFQLVTEDEHATIISVTGREKTSSNSSKFVKHLLSLIDNFTRDNVDDRYDFERTGDDIIMKDFYALSISEIIVTDSISASISLLVMLFLVRSLVLMLVPFFNLVCALLWSLCGLYIVIQFADVGTFVPAIVIAVMIAMTIDYSLFMLVRFRKELDYISPNGEPISEEDYVEAVHTTVCFAGHVISVSGTTLAISFAGICLLRIEVIFTLGLGTAMGLFFTILVNLSLGPAMLLTFPRLFSKPGVIPCAPKLFSRDNCCPCCKKKDDLALDGAYPVNSSEAQESTTLIADHAADDDAGVPNKNESVGGEEGDITARDKLNREIMSSGWYHISEILTSKEGSWLVLLLVIGALFPIIYCVRWFKYTVNNSLVFTKDLPAMQTLFDLESYFPPGMLYPIYLCAVPKDDSVGGTFNKEYFDIVPDVVKRIKNVTNNGVDDSGIISTAYAYGSEIDFDTASTLLDPSSAWYNTTEGKMYQMLADRVLTKDHVASLIILMVNFNPNAGPMQEWIESVRSILPDLDKTSAWNWSLSAVFVDEVDTSDESFRLFPEMVSITIAVIVVLVTLAFHSIVVPIRLVFSLSLTVLWTYGAATAIFCMGSVSYLPSMEDVDALYWIVSLIVLTIIVGLGIDYDVFLFSRITEERERGYTPDEAIRLGYYHTGGVITGAGVVMGIAFSGLMLSKQHVLQQLGFFLSTSVILDTFVVRMLLVPAVLHLLGNANWWPRRLPPSTLPNLRESVKAPSPRRGYDTISA